MIMMPEDVPTWDQFMPLAAVACGIFHKYHKTLPRSLALEAI